LNIDRPGRHGNQFIDGVQTGRRQIHQRGPVGLTRLVQRDPVSVKFDRTHAPSPAYAPTDSND